jgi:hypothetical protein
MAEATINRVPLVEGRISIHKDGSANLIGIQCKNCSIRAFPGGKLCPSCGKDEIEEVALNTRGKVWTYTIVHVSYGSIVLVPPYATAFVELEDGAFVHTPLVDCELDDVKIGMDVELVLLPTSTTDDEETVVYAFRPLVS